MLAIKNLFVEVDGKRILNGVNLSLRPGEIHVLMGPNGSGKSSLANVLMGHPNYTIDKGQLTIDKKNIAGMTPDKRAKKGMFLAFQYPVSVEGVTVEQLMRKVKERVKTNGKAKMTVLEFRKKVEKEAEKLGVKKELLRRSINEGFSGGEKKKLEILQLAMLEPKYAILDETDSGLDIDGLKSVARGVKKIAAKNSKLGVLLITHYQRLLKYIKPDRVSVMKQGKIVASGDIGLAAKIEKKGYGKYVVR